MREHNDARLGMMARHNLLAQKGFLPTQEGRGGTPSAEVGQGGEAPRTRVPTPLVFPANPVKLLPNSPW